jgi:hypothetical protein
MKTGPSIQTLIGGDTQTHRQQADLKSLLLLFQNEESRLKVMVVIVMEEIPSEKSPLFCVT